MMPSVTQVLAPWMDWGNVPEERLQEAAERGRRVHSLCASYARGSTFQVFEAPEDEGYFRSFVRWFDARVEEVLFVETDLTHPRHNYKGHPDLICRIIGDSALTVVDYKTPIAKHRAWELQLAGYVGLANAALKREQDEKRVQRGLSVRLKPDGSRALVDELDSPELAYRIFLQALNVWKYFNT